VPCKINLIPFNPFPIRASCAPAPTIERFGEVLGAGGLVGLRARRRGTKLNGIRLILQGTGENQIYELACVLIGVVHPFEQ